MDIKNLDHLGLVAGTIDEIGIEEIINNFLGESKTEKVSAGRVVKAMILNALGLFSSPLYLFSKFFEGKAIEHLIGQGVKSDYLNDDRLGRVLDKLYKAGIGKIFVALSLETIKKYQINMQTAHLDASSFCVHGEYNYPEIEDGVEEPRPIKITHGYSRDRRPDLKQYTMELICSGDSDIPLWMKMGDGNESEQKQFAKAIKEFKKTFKFEGLMVADAALYSQENLQYLDKIEWLSRVPLSIKSAYKLVTEIDSDKLKKSVNQEYSYEELEQNYGTIEQRWLLVESQERRKSDLKKLEKKIQKDYKEAIEKLKELKARDFACKPDAIKAANKLLKKSKYHRLTEIEAIEAFLKKDEGGKISEIYEYKVEATVTVCEERIQPDKRKAGRFIVATNLLDKERLSSEEMLVTYKNGQQSVERGFGFLKDPMFFVDSVFLKSPKRIEALGLIMALSLLVYKVAEREIRHTLERTGSKVKNQLGSLTARPTLRWLFQCFQSIHIYIDRGIKRVSNLNKERLYLLKFFPPTCQRYYLLAE